MHSLCFQCDLKQADKINELLKLNHIQHENMKFMIQEILDHCDMSKTNPEIMKEIWDKITLHISNEDPYKNIKKLYNNLLLEMEDQLKDIVQDHLNIALKMSIIANIIDFSAKDNIDINTLMNSFINARELHLACDDSNQLLKILETAKTLYYLGDNCGEIVLDKQFIQLIKKHYPQIEITYVVKEKPIVNDVTLQDCIEVKMDQICRCISHGDHSLGCVLPLTSSSFQKELSKVDVIISKGQGNYEGLYQENLSNIYYLMMVKCKIIANLTGYKVNDLVCMKGK